MSGGAGAVGVVAVLDDVLGRIDALLDAEPEPDDFPWTDAAVWYAAEAGGEPPPRYRTYREMVEAVMAYGEVALPDMGT